MGFFNKLRNLFQTEGNPNVTIWGLGDLLYCQKCEEPVSSVHHECQVTLPKSVRFEDERKEENKFRKQYLKKVGGWSVVTNEVSAFTPDELEAVAEHMRQLDEEVP